MNNRSPAFRVSLYAASGLLLVAGFLAYLRPAFMVDLTNMVLAWCG
ncbi:hypothetical protein CURE108131_20480 [Cupriavidus respiraculi]|uniref:Uncharacterized protein n=1 Tax=Cupriavidus respiraculi TaxID=195930 RepID=A0ABM8XEE4_9BURK|nr:hypothetical protein [Cupriavidus respiraculi]MBY4948730.1 hypothetical protein [Cupriavidus respiraculi]CAG9178480.1 hypothetical protein LMG21510_03596 [Cupriavidus respiraculi]